MTLPVPNRFGIFCFSSAFPHSTSISSHSLLLLPPHFSDQEHWDWVTPPPKVPGINSCILALRFPPTTDPPSPFLVRPPLLNIFHDVVLKSDIQIGFHYIREYARPPANPEATSPTALIIPRDRFKTPYHLATSASATSDRYLKMFSRCKKQRTRHYGSVQQENDLIVCEHCDIEKWECKLSCDQCEQEAKTRMWAAQYGLDAGSLRPDQHERGSAFYDYLNVIYLDISSYPRLGASSSSSSSAVVLPLLFPCQRLQERFKMYTRLDLCEVILSLADHPADLPLHISPAVFAQDANLVCFDAFFLLSVCLFTLFPHPSLRFFVCEFWPCCIYFGSVTQAIIENCSSVGIHIDPTALFGTSSPARGP